MYSGFLHIEEIQLLASFLSKALESMGGMKEKSLKPDDHVIVQDMYPKTFQERIKQGSLNENFGK